MAKPLDERIAAAMGDGARAATVAELIDEVSASVAISQAEHDRLDALSKSATASEAEADKAADDASKLSRKVVRLAAKRDQLQERYEDLLNSDRRRRAVEEHAAVNERRTKLVEDLRIDGPRIIGELVTLLDRIKSSEAECGALNKTRAYGLDWLDSAEAEARGCPATFCQPSGSQIPRLVNMKVPTFDASQTTELAWPVRDRTLALLQNMEQEARRQAHIKRQEEAARWKRYVVTPPTNNTAMFTIARQGGDVGVYRDVQILTLSSEMAEAARAKGCGVRPAADNESIGMPASVSVL
ncbi:hypothetical protein KRZ98_03940 [Sphingobium sp. AS12]|uniref:hypothetical protein n=1 Tax=Sphingobium sp. AS12 TaxID=2849495 RepID=UPI001C3156D5|nr:hypothetical protein [Sphingobium sp. AS12]MBV2147437.1 hypothetical protein [Sphingobium sp. AS12]